MKTSRKKVKEQFDWSDYERQEDVEGLESDCCYASVVLMKRKTNNPEGYVETKCVVCQQPCELVGDR